MLKLRNADTRWGGDSFFLRALLCIVGYTHACACTHNSELGSRGLSLSAILCHLLISSTDRSGARCLPLVRKAALRCKMALGVESPPCLLLAILGEEPSLNHGRYHGDKITGRLHLKRFIPNMISWVLQERNELISFIQKASHLDSNSLPIQSPLG